MTKITWLGGAEDTCQWRGINFRGGQPVEVNDVDTIRKAMATKGFKVEEKKHETQKAEKAESQEQKEKAYDFRENEKGSGYTPVKKKVRKKAAIPLTIPSGRADADA